MASFLNNAKRESVKLRIRLCISHFLKFLLGLLKDPPLLSTVVAHTLLNTAHTVGFDCGYNPG